MTELSLNEIDDNITYKSHPLPLHLPQGSSQLHRQYHFTVPSISLSKGTTLQHALNQLIIPDRSMENGSTLRKGNSNIVSAHLARFNTNLSNTPKKCLNNQTYNQKKERVPIETTNTSNVDTHNLNNNNRSPSSQTSSASHSPIHYRNPFNSPNISPFIYNATVHAQNDLNSKEKIQQYQENNFNKRVCKIPLLTHKQHHQQHCNNLLLQQQHLAKYQQQMLHTEDTNDEELSEENLLKNVAIILNNLNRYNNALPKVILSEQVNRCVEDGDRASIDINIECLPCSHDADINFTNDLDNIVRWSACISNNNHNNRNWINNNNINHNSNNNNNSLSNMATVITKQESDYNSNSTTPGFRTGSLKHENNRILQNCSNLIGYSYGNGSNNDSDKGDCKSSVIMCNNDDGIVNNAYLSSNLNSLASTSDSTYDNSDYQWFLDCGYRDGFNGIQRSVLSSLPDSFNKVGVDIIYEDVSKHMDANLAQADIESFRTEDIQLLLSHLPSYCKHMCDSPLKQSLISQQCFKIQHFDWIEMCEQVKQEEQNNHQVGGDHLMLQNRKLRQCQHKCNESQISTSTLSNDLMIDNIICKSELLFSPVKESRISVDSLNMDCYPEDDDIILTCKANKDNYTIAFESSVLYSDDSFYAEPNDVALKNKQNIINLHHNLNHIMKPRSLDASTTGSEKQPPNYNILQNVSQRNSHIVKFQKCPTANNNDGDVVTIIRPPLTFGNGIYKSNSLPNLKEEGHLNLAKKIKCNNRHNETDKKKNPQYDYKKTNILQGISTSSVELKLCAKGHNLLPMCKIPISCDSISNLIPNDESVHEQFKKQYQHHKQEELITQDVKNVGRQSYSHRCSCDLGVLHTSIYGNISPSSSTPRGTERKMKHIHASTVSPSCGSSNSPAFNLVKLFIKQKNSISSLEDQKNVDTYIDVSPDCWPSSDLNVPNNKISEEQLLQKKSINDFRKESDRQHKLEQALEKEENDISSFNIINPFTFHKEVEEYINKRPRCSPVKKCDKDGNINSPASIKSKNFPLYHNRRQLLPNSIFNNLTYEDNGNNNSSINLPLLKSNSPYQLNHKFNELEVSTKSNIVEHANISKYPSRNIIENSVEETQKQLPQLSSYGASSEMITKSLQTSCGCFDNTCTNFKNRFRCVPPSFLEKLNNLGKECQAPIYVIYPNYALPDLAFVKNSTTPDIIFSPFNYKMTVGGVTSSDRCSISMLKKRFHLGDGSEENQIFQTLDYKHVIDWVSLAVLLPPDYRCQLKHIPEVNNVLNQLKSELSNKPSFCLTPAIRRNRPQLCDCVQYYQKDQQTEGGGGILSSGSSQQPSSGYQGSSTLLTDSDFGNNTRISVGTSTGIGANNIAGNTFKQMYVYQYEPQRLDAALEVSPKVSCDIDSTIMPKGILRKNSSSVHKRNSMVESGEKMHNQLNIRKIEKRRSWEESLQYQRNRSFEDSNEAFEYDYEEKIQKETAKLSHKNLNTRVRCENFLSLLPRNELKHYAEIAAIVESSDQHVQYDSAALKKEVSWALREQKKVSFTDHNNIRQQSRNKHVGDIKSMKQYCFTTPPNSRNISVESSAREVSMGLTTTATTTMAEKYTHHSKRIQTQYKLKTKDSNLLKHTTLHHQVKSGTTTPTFVTPSALKSRIPRPVSYPLGKKTDEKSKNSISHTNRNHRNTKIAKPLSKSPVILYSTRIGKLNNQNELPDKVAKSPNRIVPPKRYNSGANLLPTPNVSNIKTVERSKTAHNKAVVTASNTPKKPIQLPRVTPLVR